MLRVYNFKGIINELSSSKYQEVKSSADCPGDGSSNPGRKLGLTFKRRFLFPAQNFHETGSESQSHKFKLFQESCSFAAVNKTTGRRDKAFGME
jgi:hypothetical protein